MLKYKRKGKRIGDNIQKVKDKKQKRKKKERVRERKDKGNLSQ